MIKARNIAPESGVNKFYIEWEQDTLPLQIYKFELRNTVADEDLFAVSDLRGRVVEAGALVDAGTGALNSGSITVAFYIGTTTVNVLSATLSFASAAVANLYVTGTLATAGIYVSGGSLLLMRVDATATVSTANLVGKLVIETNTPDVDELFHITRNGRVTEILTGSRTAIAIGESGSVSLGFYRGGTATTTNLLTSATITFTTATVALRPNTAALATSSARSRPGRLGGMAVSASTAILMRIDTSGPITLDGLFASIEIEWDE